MALQFLSLYIQQNKNEEMMM